ncbi:MAG: hypothetical protein PHN45_11805 [Methylococcales bacterium]|nr:hypothetical protein [Methylococcales bacterium]MDD5755419.1 hypothetical protein [Methylococcales bacterium]
MNMINASELKTRGVAAIELALKNEQDVAISVRGKTRFVVVDVDYFQHLRECELESAVHNVRADIEAGRFVDETAEEHIERITKEYELSTTNNRGLQ